MKFKSINNKKIKIFDKLKKFSTKRVFLIEMNKGDIRGNHGHRKHNQIMLLFSGKIEIYYFNTKINKIEKKKTLHEGQLFEMHKNIHVRFFALKKSKIVVLADKNFNKNDYFTK